MFDVAVLWWYHGAAVCCCEEGIQLTYNSIQLSQYVPGLQYQGDVRIQGVQLLLLHIAVKTLRTARHGTVSMFRWALGAMLLHTPLQGQLA